VADMHTGTCFCGAIEVQATGAPIEMGYCHCNSCRSYSAEPVRSFMLWKTEDVRIAKGDEFVGRFNKTGMSDRHFCTKCGGHLLTVHPALGLTDVGAALFPDIAFKPVVHLHYAETVQPMKDGLPKLKDFPAAAGGSGKTIPE
jgi:hypothetical protein